LWWTGAKPGDKLALDLPVAKSGKFRLIMNLTKAADYGVVQLLLDGKRLGGPIDLFHPSATPTGELEMGTHELSSGSHVLLVEVNGANDKAVKSYMFGLDYVKITPTE
jgi:hypothetical protein